MTSCGMGFSWPHRNWDIFRMGWVFCMQEWRTPVHGREGSSFGAHLGEDICPQPEPRAHCSWGHCPGIKGCSPWLAYRCSFVLLDVYLLDSLSMCWVCGEFPVRGRLTGEAFPQELYVMVEGEVAWMPRGSLGMRHMQTMFAIHRGDRCCPM